MDPLYLTLRALTSPIVAITTSSQGRANGLIINSAQRASLVPEHMRVSMYISKTNLTHDLIWSSGVFGMHLLRTDQFDVVRALGIRSGREGDKMSALPTRRGETGCPLLTDCLAALECRVTNAMDAGAATFFLGDVVNAASGTAGDIMTADYFRANLPPDLRAAYEANLALAQQYLASLSATVDPERVWPGPSTTP
ncbi:MAG TPA: flavin reductase family protein [Longimicrobiales bacterium]